jgi:hypothetical protein
MKLVKIKITEPFSGVVSAQINDHDCCLSCKEDLDVCWLVQRLVRCKVNVTRCECTCHRFTPRNQHVGGHSMSPLPLLSPGTISHTTCKRQALMHKRPPVTFTCHMCATKFDVARWWLTTLGRCARLRPACQLMWGCFSKSIHCLHPVPIALNIRLRSLANVYNCDLLLVQLPHSPPRPCKALPQARGFRGKPQPLNPGVQGSGHGTTKPRTPRGCIFYQLLTYFTSFDGNLAWKYTWFIGLCQKVPNLTTFLIFFVRFDHVKHLGAGLDVSFGGSRCFLVIGYGSFNENFMQTASWFFCFSNPGGSGVTPTSSGLVLWADSQPPDPTPGAMP